MEAVIPYGSGPTRPLAVPPGPRGRVDGRPVARRWLVFWAVVITAVYAALWSPYWYPLSDSSLYVSLGRSVSLGRGMTMMGDPVRLVPPLTPRFLGLLMWMGAGIGAIQATMTALMLVSFALSFLTLRRWTGSERLALAATVAGAMSYWVFANAFTVMSEPLCLVMMWGGFLALTHVAPASRWRWATVLAAALLLLLAAMNRDAVLPLLPGPVLAMLMRIPRGGRRTKEAYAWGAMFAVVFGGWVFYRYPPKAIEGFFHPKPPRKVPMPTTNPVIRLKGDRGAATRATTGQAAAPATARATTGATTAPAATAPTTRLSKAARAATRAAVAAPSTETRSDKPEDPKIAGGDAGANSGSKLARPARGGRGAGPADGGEPEHDDDDAPREGRYKGAWMQGVRRDYHMLTEPPRLGGRWVCEGLVMASVQVFESKSPLVAAAGYVVAVGAFAIAIIGAVGMFLGGRFWLIGCGGRATLGRRWRVLRGRGAWWVLGPALYFVVIWLPWGIRIKARYMAPVAPVLFLFLWHGTTTLALWAGRRVSRRPGGWSPVRTARRVAAAGLALVVIGNAYPWAVEVYVRHFAKRDFYDVARRGAYAQLVDIGAYAQREIPPGETIVMTVKAHRRIAYFLTGHRLDLNLINLPDWPEWQRVLVLNTREKFAQPIPFRKRYNAVQRRRRFLSAMPADARHIIAFVDHPGGREWPGWHLPMKPDDDKAQWWRLYERVMPEDTWRRVSVPRGRDYVSGIPGAGQ